MTERNIAIGIDSTKAETGGRVVKRNLDEIGNAAVTMEKKVDSANISLARMASGANDNLKRVSQSAQAAGGNLGRLQTMMAGLGSAIRITIASLVTMAGILATIAAASIVGNFIKLSDTFKNMTSQLRLVTSGTAELADTQEKLFQVAQRTRSSYESTTTLYARLARSASALGLSQKDLLQITENINKTFQISGASADEAKNSIKQLAQGLASGALRGDEFNAVAESAPRLLQAVAEHLKMGVGQLRAYAAEGKITAKVLSEALLAATDKLNKEFDLMGVTIGQAMTVLGNSVLRAVGQMDEALGISDAIASGIIAISKAIDGLGDTLSAAAPYLAIIGTGLALAFGPTIVATVGGLAIAIGVGLVEAISAASVAMVAFSMSNPFTAILLAITTAVAAIYHFRDEIQKALGIDVMAIIKDTVNYLIGSFVAAWEDIKALWNAFPDMLGAAFVGGVNIAIEQLNRLTEKFTAAINLIIDGLNLVGAGLENLDPNTGKLDTIFNTYLISLELAIKDRNKLINDALNTDWLGKITKIFTPQEAAPMPGATTTTPANSNVPAELQKIIQATNDKIRALQSEAEALKLTGYAASVYREQQELINAALAKGLTLTPQQTEELKKLGEQMAALKSANAGTSMLQDQQSQIGRLQLENQLITASVSEREKALAVYDAQQQMMQKGIDLNSAQAQAITANAAAMAQLKLENERVAAAYSTIQQTGASAIDSLVQGATTVGNSWKDTFKNIATSFVQTFTQLAVANPLKNMLLGQNNPTITDLFTKGTSALTPGATSTGTMTVTAATVMVNGGVLPGLTPGTTSTLGSVLGVPNAANDNAIKAAANPALAGLINDPSLASKTALTPGTPMGLNATEQMTWNHFAAQGMQPHQIAAVMGNIKAESNFNPAAVGDGGNAFGLAQWNDRGPAMKAYVGPNYATDTQGQLNFMSHEFATSENPAYQRLMASTNVTEANNAMLGFERPSGFSLANPTGAHQYTNRLAYSQDYLQRANSTGTLSAAANDNSTASLPNLDQANQSLAKLSTTSLKASTDVSSLSTGADTAAKALSSSSNSVTSSVSSLATTTAQIPQQTQGLFSSMMSSIGGGFSSIFSGIGSLFGGLFAEGGVFKNGNVTAFAAGGVVGGPTMFPMRNGMGIMGERGPEAIMPLRRGPDGNLGVMMHAGLGAGPGSQNVQYMIRMENVIKVEGVGDKDLMTKIHDGVDKQMGDNLKRFSREELPGHVKKIQSDKWARG